MDIKNFIIGTLIGSIVGFLSGWEGISNSEFIQLALILTGISHSQSLAAGTTLLAMLFPISAFAVWDYYKRKKVELIKMLKIQHKKLEEAISNGKKHRIERRKIKIEEIKSALSRLTKEIMEQNNGVLPGWWKKL